MLWRDKEVKIFNKQGEIVNIIPLSEEIMYVFKRVCRGLKSGLWYKGAGILYRGHFSVEPDGCEILGKADMDYIGWRVMRREWIGKFGIFQEKYQSYFSDWVGGCGKKERKIIENSEKFGKSSVRVEDVIEIGNEHAIYIVDYLHRKTGRVKLEGLMKTLLYMLKEGWNFPWDKNVLDDVDDEGYVTDVADLFRGEDLVSRFGTVYAVFCGILRKERLRREFFERYKVELREDLMPFAVFVFLKRIGIDVSEIGQVKVGKEDYARLMKNYVINGKLCAGLEDENWGKIARSYYLEKLEGALNAN